MIADSVRRVLLKAGRASTRGWVRRLEAANPALYGDTRRTYSELSGRVAWPTKRALQMHLVFSVLPGAALYLTLVNRGRSKDEAAEAIKSALTAMNVSRARRIERLTRTGAGRRLFMQIARHSLRAFPAPGWEATWVERSAQRVAFNMTRCFDLDTLRTLDAIAIAPAYCAVDDVLYSRVGPPLQWARSGTLATGATHCDFCFMNTPMPDSQPEPSRATPPKPDLRP